MRGTKKEKVLRTVPGKAVRKLILSYENYQNNTVLILLYISRHLILKCFFLPDFFLLPCGVGGTSMARPRIGENVWVRNKFMAFSKIPLLVKCWNHTPATPLFFFHFFHAKSFTRYVCLHALHRLLGASRAGQWRTCFQLLNASANNFRAGGQKCYKKGRREDRP